MVGKSDGVPSTERKLVARPRLQDLIGDNVSYPPAPVSTTPVVAATNPAGAQPRQPTTPTPRPAAPTPTAPTPAVPTPIYVPPKIVGNPTGGGNINAGEGVDHAIPRGGAPAGSGGSDHDWYLREIGSKPSQYDTGISEGQWVTWKNMGLWDEATKSWRNENVDAAGNPIGGTGWNKPVDCPDGTAKFNINQCLPHSDPRVGGSGNGGGGGAAGGAGGGGRGGASASGSFGSSAPSTAFGQQLEGQLTADMSSPSRYTPEALQALYGEITRAREGAVRRGNADVRANAAGRGMSRAGSVDAALRGVRAGAEQQAGAANVGVMQAKITADFQDKSAALDRAQRYLDSLRDNEYRYMLTSEQRRQFDANLALAYANLNQQKSQFNAQLQSNWDMLRANQGYNQINQGA